jgi:hypothetical protein
VCHLYKVSRSYKNVLLGLQIQINPRSHYNVINKFGNVYTALTILACLILSLDFKFKNNFKSNTENTSILKVPFNILHGTLKYSSNLSKEFTFGHTQLKCYCYSIEKKFRVKLWCHVLTQHYIKIMKQTTLQCSLNELWLCLVPGKLFCKCI